MNFNFLFERLIMDKIKYLMAENCYNETRNCFGFHGEFINQFWKENLYLYIKSNTVEHDYTDEDNVIDINYKNLYKVEFYRLCSDTLDRDSRQTFESTAYELKYAFSDDIRKELTAFNLPKLIGLNDLYVDLNELFENLRHKISAILY